MTLDAFSWLAIFFVFGGFLVLTAYIAENWPRQNPLNPDRRHQAHPIGDYRPRLSAGRSPVSSFPPVGTGLGVERPADSRERIGSVVPD